MSGEFPEVLPLERLEHASGIGQALSLHVYTRDHLLFGELAIYDYWKSEPNGKVETIQSEFEVVKNTIGNKEYFIGKCFRAEKDSAARTIRITLHYSDQTFDLAYQCSSGFSYCRISP
jgi:hypothetical protein